MQMRLQLDGDGVGIDTLPLRTKVQLGQANTKKSMENNTFIASSELLGFVLIFGYVRWQVWGKGKLEDLPIRYRYRHHHTDN